MTQHAFVTGGAGFVGGHVITLLKAQGWQVTALHRPRGNRERLEALGARPVAAQMHDVAQLTEVLPERADAVFHIAGNTSLWRRQDQSQYRDNVVGTRAVVAAALARGAKRLVHTSSISAYGIQKQPIDEDTPSTAEHDWISYNRTKYLAEQEVRKGIAEGLDAVILNPCGIIGAGDTHNWSQLISLINAGKLPGVPPGSGSFCHVGEVARAHLSAWEKGRTGANYILSGIDASLLDVVRVVCKLLDRKPPRRTVPPLLLRLAGHLYPLAALITGDEPRLTPEKVALVTNRVVASSARAEKELGFNSKVSLETMLRECIDWMRAEAML
ncbi:NAD-dependent epimerase/dehydratase family protein [Isoalcanivorax indicus]|uniref:NAD-dependent epimerase/dehydratase family protein n=1 Tax=Isoalcanivorax indicus TaxID=2202653 RepID=UPI000DB99EFA|nr:NAD-dependent epimerase/dehydratase family protein [Isoalcanivorax indicus]